MTKQLNIEIKKCEDCPYFENVYNRYPDATYTSSDEFICKKKQGYSHRLIDRKVFDQHNFLHEDCPLKDTRKPGVMVGVSVFLINEQDEILVGNREDGTWGLPGGGMEAGETPKETAVREIGEETSIIIHPKNLVFATFTNDIFLEEKNEHWITLYFYAYDFEGKAERVEPNKCKEWRWVDLDNIPKPVFCDWAKNIEELKALIL